MLKSAWSYGGHLSSCRLSGLLVTAARCGSSLSRWISRWYLNGCRLFVVHCVLNKIRDIEARHPLRMRCTEPACLRARRCARVCVCSFARSLARTSVGAPKPRKRRTRRPRQTSASSLFPSHCLIGSVVLSPSPPASIIYCRLLTLRYSRFSSHLSLPRRMEVISRLTKTNNGRSLMFAIVRHEQSFTTGGLLNTGCVSSDVIRFRRIVVWRNGISIYAI